jgi:hypothetical protein
MADNIISAVTYNCTLDFLNNQTLEPELQVAPQGLLASLPPSTCWAIFCFWLIFPEFASTFFTAN